MRVAPISPQLYIGGIVMEKWKVMKEHNNYEISNYGKVRNKKTGRIRKTTINNKGYEQIIVYINKKPKTYYIHRLVASNFIENPNNYKEVNHLDENKLNNNVNNLEWCNGEYNLHYGTRVNRILKTKEPTFKQIIQKDRHGNIIKIWKNIIEIQKNTKFNKQCIHYCCSGRLKTSGGYIWEYADVL